MRRALIAAASAALGTAAVVLLGPHPGSAGAELTQDDTRPSGSAASTSTPRATGPSGVQQVAGPVVRDEWGPVQVHVTTRNGTLTDVSMLQQPGDGRSRFINSRAVPLLVSQALQAQSAHIDGVSGATATTRAFVQSLAAALRQAGLR